MQVDNEVVNLDNLLVVRVFANSRSLDGTIDGPVAELLRARRALHFLIIVNIIGLIAGLWIVQEALCIGAFRAEVAMVVVLVWELLVTQLLTLEAQVIGENVVRLALLAYLPICAERTVRHRLIAKSAVDVGDGLVHLFRLLV